MADESASTPYSPIDAPTMREITDNIVQMLKQQDCLSFPPTPFRGAGVYAIYYFGDFSLYHPITVENLDDCSMPIYIGKAVPQGRRKGVAKTSGNKSTALYRRLREHSGSLSHATNLRLEDFRFRYLRIVDGLIELAESELIQYYKPVWNGCLDGFGNHPVGKGRISGRRPGWDEVHPGRLWSLTLQPSKHSVEEWHQMIAKYFAQLAAGTLKRIEVVDDGGQ